MLYRKKVDDDYVKTKFWNSLGELKFRLAIEIMAERIFCLKMFFHCGTYNWNGSWRCRINFPCFFFFWWCNRLEGTCNRNYTRNEVRRKVIKNWRKFILFLNDYESASEIAWIEPNNMKLIFKVALSNNCWVKIKHSPYGWSLNVHICLIVPSKRWPFASEWEKFLRIV